MSDLLDDLEWRGLVADSTDREALEAHLAQGPVTFYVGFDPTAKSLHIGHLVQLMLVRASRNAAISRCSSSVGRPVLLVILR